MTPGLGRALILLGLLLSTAGAFVCFAAGARPSELGRAWARRFAYAYAATMVAANALMVYALLAHDFSVGYVAQVGSRFVPAWVSIVSLWSSLEGSILFWGLVLGLYVAAATWSTRDAHPEYMPFAIGVWLAVGSFFCFLLAGPAQPFHTVPNPPTDGPGPNPLLQNHILMAIHPPFLYLGYVGMTISFGLASAALIVGRLGADFLRSVRTWLLLPWIFQTAAIVLGGWWAYEVLGWGGYWAWDPVENASLLPWLTATAALHSALLTERKGILKGWTTTLLMATFLLTILGTFMTRSGVFNSVHSFTQSAIGPTILAFLATALIWSVGLLAFRIDRLVPDSQLGDARSREAGFLLNNLLFVLLTFTVLIGTVFPLVVEAARGVQMSVGRPYFDRMAVPLGAALLLMMGVGPALPWGRASSDQLRRALLPPLAGAAALLLLGLALGVRNAWLLLTLSFGGYALQVTLAELWLPVRQRRASIGESWGRAFVTAQLERGRRRFGGYVVHVGAIVLILAVGVSSTLGISKELQVERGQVIELGDYTLRFLGLDEISEPHRQSVVANIEVRCGDRELAVMQPRMNTYGSQREPIGTPDVKTFLTEDLYLSMLNVEPGGQRMGLLAMVNPMVGWIWIATGIMTLGGFIGLWPSRRVARAPLAAAEPALATPAAETP